MSDSPTKPKRRRRLLRYSLRSLLLVMLALSIWLGWMANEAAKQRRAVELVRELGGSVFYDCQKLTTTVAGTGPSMGGNPNNRSGTVRSRGRTTRKPRGAANRSSMGRNLGGASSRSGGGPSRSPWAPKPLYESPPEDDFLHKYIGHEWFHNVIHVRLIGLDVTDEQLAGVIDDLPHIVRLHLHHCRVTDTGIERVVTLEKLESIVLDRCDVTHEGVERLRRRGFDVQVSYPRPWTPR